jgi:putative transposase
MTHAWWERVLPQCDAFVSPVVLEEIAHGDPDRALLAEFGFTAQIRARGEAVRALKQEAGFRARRWVVERTHSGTKRCRRGLIRWAKKVRNYPAFLHLACAYMTCSQSGLLG